MTAGITFAFGAVLITHYALRIANYALQLKAATAWSTALVTRTLSTSMTVGITFAAGTVTIPNSTFQIPNYK